MSAATLPLSHVRQLASQLEPASNYLIYLTTNEIAAAAMNALSQLPAQGNAVVGVSCLHIFNIASIRSHIEFIIGIDHSYETHAFWKEILPIIHSAPNRTACALKIKELVLQNAAFFYRPREGAYSPADRAPKACDQLDREIEEGGSWLSTDERFNQVKRLVRQDQVFHLPIDLCERDLVKKLALALRADHVAPDTLYVANVLDYVARTHRLKHAFKDSVRSLALRTGTYVVRSCFPPESSVPPFLLRKPSCVEFKEQYIDLILSETREPKDASRQEGLGGCIYKGIEFCTSPTHRPKEFSRPPHSRVFS